MRSEHVQSVKNKLLTIIRAGNPCPGDPFLSNRAIARRFHVSYQTADNLVRELVQEGRLERRPGSGTYLPGGQPKTNGVLLIFNTRAKRKTGFGSRILDELTTHLTSENIPWGISWRKSSPSRQQRLPKKTYFVIWECPELVESLVAAGRRALLLNDRPPPGFASSLIDSVSVDEFSGGAAAAQFLKRQFPLAEKVAIFAGPGNDMRSAALVNGFLSVASATVFTCPPWHYEDALSLADKVVASGKDGILCCSDRLAEAVVRSCMKRGIRRPPLVNFGDAPSAQWLNLTTMAIPWTEMVAAASRVIKQRQFDESSCAIAQLITTKLIIRS